MSKNKHVIVHLTELKPMSTIASARITKFIRYHLKIGMLVDNKLDAQIVLDEVPKIDILYLVNGPPAFCDFREEIAEMVRRCKTLVWIQNDYTIYPPSQVNSVCRERDWVDNKGHISPPYRWTTIPKRMKTIKDAYINWNCLTFDPRYIQYDRKKTDLFYFGAYREFRIDSFKKYLVPAQKHLTISGSGRAEKRFKGILPDAKYIPPQEDIIGACTKFRYGLYIHDNNSANLYCSLANRFYEMLSAKMLIFVADNAVDTFKEAGYPVPEELIVADGYEINSLMRMPMHRFRHLVAYQQKLWMPLAKLENKKLPVTLRSANRRVKCTL